MKLLLLLFVPTFSMASGIYNTGSTAVTLPFPAGATNYIQATPSSPQAADINLSGSVTVASSVSIVGTTTNNYSLKVTTSVTPSTFFHIAISTSGHLITSGSPPSLGSCGTNPSVVGDDNQGIITVGSGVSVTACTMNFMNSWGVGCNVACQAATNSTAAIDDVSAISATSVTFSFSVSLGGGLIFYRCSGSGGGCR